jgi:hypothetical protein
MAIQVNDFEMTKPARRVTKPRRGESPFIGIYAMGGGPESMNNRPPAGGMTAFVGGMDSRILMPQYGASGGMTTPDQRKGVDVRGKDRAKAREEQEKAASKRAAVTVHDPYFNVVQVTVYGRVRLYNPPPEELAPDPSQGRAPAPEVKAEGPEAKEETPKDEPGKAVSEGPKAQGGVQK